MAQKDPRKDIIKTVSKIIDDSGIPEELSEQLKNGLKLMSTCPCYGDGGKQAKEKKKTARGEFMGNCMRSPEKGGEGKDMKTCSVEWNITKEVKK